MRVHLLRQRMLLLVQQLLAFYTIEIIEPNWHELERKLHEAQSVDEFMKHHFDFLNTCRKECMCAGYRPYGPMCHPHVCQGAGPSLGKERAYDFDDGGAGPPAPECPS